jgi:hypothetical protein
MASFTGLQQDVTDASSQLDLADIDSKSIATPVDLAGLREIAKSPASKTLYSAFNAYTQALVAFTTCCQGIGMTPIDASTEATKLVRKVVSIFIATQALTRKLKPSETRQHACATIIDKLFDMPPPLMLLVSTAIGQHSAIDADAHSIQHHDSDADES